MKVGSAKSKVKMVPLREVAELNPPLDSRNVDGDTTVSFVPMSAVSELSASVTNGESRTAAECRKGYTAFRRNDILVARITPCFENGKIAQANICHEYGFGSTEFHVIRPNSEHLDARYVLHFLRQPWVREEGKRRMTGSAGQRRVPASFLSTFEIPLPTLPAQRRIAAILDKADAIRRKRAEALHLTDDFLKSVFLDMFGDPVTNSKGWPLGVLGDLIHSAKDGPHVSPQYSDEGIPFLSTRNIRPGRVIWEDLKYISPDEAERHWKKCKPEFGDILYTKGGTTGLAKAIDFEEEIAVWVHIALLKTNHDVTDPYWLETMLNSAYCYAQSQEFTHGIANRDLGLSRMVKTKLYVPPLSRQKEFAEYTQRIRQMQSEIVRSSENIESLFSSLNQRAFRGEL